MSAALTTASKTLVECCRHHCFGEPVTHVYYPLEYAWAAYEQYLRRYGNGRKRAIFVGMNPGPWGMGQTGIPFGDVVSVRDWLGIEEEIAAPPYAHASRPVQGFACRRREVSGSRLWAFFAERYGSSAAFFSEYYVLNYCPLLFLRASGANITPDKLSVAQTAPLYRCCDRFLQAAVATLKPHLLIGVGGFAAARLKILFGDSNDITIGKILHPSPASPLANRDFAGIAAAQLDALGI